MACDERPAYPPPSDSDDDFQIDEDLVPAAAIKAAGTGSLDFDGPLSKPLRLHEDLKDGCGGQLWPAGIELAKHLLRPAQRQALVGKNMFVG